MFTDDFEPDPRSRPVFTFHRPETLARWLRRWRDDAAGGSLRARLDRLDTVPKDRLRRIQVEARGRVEASMRVNRPRALAQDSWSQFSGLCTGRPSSPWPERISRRTSNPASMMLAAGSRHRCGRTEQGEAERTWSNGT
jgi:hypothetical protein